MPRQTIIILHVVVSFSDINIKLCTLLLLLSIIHCVICYLLLMLYCLLSSVYSLLPIDRYVLSAFLLSSLIDYSLICIVCLLRIAIYDAFHPFGAPTTTASNNTQQQTSNRDKYTCSTSATHLLGATSRSPVARLHCFLLFLSYFLIIWL